MIWSDRALDFILRYRCTHRLSPVPVDPYFSDESSGSFGPPKSISCAVKRPYSGRRSCVHRQEPGHMFAVTGEMGRGLGPSVA